MIDTHLSNVETTAIFPALVLLGMQQQPQARIQLLAIGLQETRFETRRQYNNGPAASFWQFERGGGIKGVLTHAVTRAKALALCEARNVLPEQRAVWEAMLTDDVIGAGFARLLLLSDPKPLPTTQADGWAYYLRTWRPGKPHPDTWPAFYARAEAHVKGL